MEYPMWHTRKWCMFFLDLIYPNVCPCCHQKIVWNRYLCETCAKLMTPEENLFCPGCGKPWEQCICGAEQFYDRAVVATTYDVVGKTGVLSMKKAESLQFGWHCTAVFLEQMQHDASLCAYDGIVPVLMNQRKKRTRFCNPAEVLAKELSSLTGIPMRTDVLLDRGNGQTQHLLSAQVRKRNVEKFAIQPVNLTDSRIILCDDVLTTGSAMNYCAKLLKSRGAVSVAVFAATSTVLRAQS